MLPRARMEPGLSFFEFNYMLLEAYDYLLSLPPNTGAGFRSAGMTSGQYALAGADLIRQVEGGRPMS